MALKLKVDLTGWSNDRIRKLCKGEGFSNSTCQRAIKRKWVTVEVVKKKKKKTKKKSN